MAYYGIGITSRDNSDFVKAIDNLHIAASLNRGPFLPSLLEKPANLTPFRQLNLTTGSRDLLTPSFLTTTAKNFS